MVWLYETSIVLNLLSIFYLGEEGWRFATKQRLIASFNGSVRHRPVQTFSKLIPGNVADHSI
jgi:hypothetical protein